MGAINVSVSQDFLNLMPSKCFFNRAWSLWISSQQVPCDLIMTAVAQEVLTGDTWPKKDPEGETREDRSQWDCQQPPLPGPLPSVGVPPTRVLRGEGVEV